MTLASHMSEYATVDEVIEMLKKLSQAGHGEMLVVCNAEYYLARKDEVPEFKSKDGHAVVSLGGYY